MNNKFFFIFFLLSTSSFAATTGTIKGIITDVETNEPLAGANVFIEGTSKGAATDIEGKYRIPNVPAGECILVVTYIGYQDKRQSVTVMPDEIMDLDIQLNFDALEGEVIVVTGQLEGQSQAINRQISANTIVNVVSSDKIQELPDQNAAESVGRLPGISIQRDAGEGQKVIVRGLAPRFNSITINGVRIPSTDPENRSVDLSMISPDVLAGIEVFKALTPDHDGDEEFGTIFDTGPDGVNDITDPLYGIFPFDLSYSTEATSYTAGDGGLPLGDLNWFPEKKAEWITSIEQNPVSGSPAEFRLSQNYPNPFNPVTQVAYNLARKTHVTLSIYNTVGQKVATLVDKEQTAGSKTVTWNGTSDNGTLMSTGLYFYHLNAGEFNQTRKMLFLK